LTAVPYPVASVRSGVVAQAAELELVGDPDVALVNVRSREEFTGQRFWPPGGMQDEGRAVHVLTAVPF